MMQRSRWAACLCTWPDLMVRALSSLRRKNSDKWPTLVDGKKPVDLYAAARACLVGENNAPGV